eukprot:3214532-Alexandrium_andersonii.AAC.1
MLAWSNKCWPARCRQAPAPAPPRRQIRDQAMTSTRQALPSSPQTGQRTQKKSAARRRPSRTERSAVCVRGGPEERVWRDWGGAT